MDEMKKTDKRFLILHRAGWSIGDTAFVGKQGICWLVYGTNGDHSSKQRERARWRLGRRRRLTRSARTD